jgi:rubredoxin
MADIRARAVATVRQDGIRLVATTTADLIDHIRQSRRELRKIVEELRSPYSTARVSEQFDGSWSKAMEELALHLNATGLELNQWWAMLKPDWTCPCYRRPKNQIAHKNATGVLIAKVVDHHDHFINYINRTFREQLGRSWNVGPDGRQDVQQAISQNFLAFENVVICESCNKADRDAKMTLTKALSLEPDFMEAFSFSVDEIRFFISSGPNRHHKVDDRRALKMFTERRKIEIFEFRKKAVTEQVGLLARGVHWRSPERHPSREDVSSAANDMLDNMGLNTGDNFDLIGTSCTTLRGGEAPHVWRKSGQQRQALPAEAQVAAFLAATPDWKEIPAGWTCPCCGRPPKHIVRYSKDRVLHGRLCQIGIHPQQTTICMDCKDIANGLAREASVDVRLLQLGEISSLLIIRRNQRHKLASQVGADHMVEKVRVRLAPPEPIGNKGFDGDGFVAV